MLHRFTNLKITIYEKQLSGGRTKVISDELYGKVIEAVSDNPAVLRVNFTSVPPEVHSFFSTGTKGQCK
ncbi:MAG TPA: hypothetical protein VJL89_13775 [Thermodesulfovibrionia bacterium]|nr:hypothetical protein [Thermodesulfovibrionia bacterium]